MKVYRMDVLSLSLKDNFFPASSELWDSRSILLMIGLSIIQLIASLLNFDNIVWEVNWHSSYLISEGVPMYEQMGLYKHHGLPPDHFPVYFYMMAAVIIIFGNNEVMGRIITWLFVVASSYFVVELAEPRTKTQLRLILAFYFLDPMLIVINYYGKFGQITIFFIFLGIYLVRRQKFIAAGVALGLGVMVKFFPIFAIIATGSYLLKQRKYRDTIRFSLASMLTIFTIFGYHYYRWGNQFLDVILFQINRVTPSLSLWYYVLPHDIEGTRLVLYQFLFYLAIFVLMFMSNIETNHYYLLAASSLLAATYLVPNRQYYSTYAYFFIAPLYPVFVELYRQRKYGLLGIPLVAYLGLFQLGNLFCYNSCYPQIRPFTYLSWIGVMLVFLSTVVFIPYYFLLTNRRALDHQYCAP